MCPTEAPRYAQDDPTQPAAAGHGNHSRLEPRTKHHVGPPSRSSVILSGPTQPGQHWSDNAYYCRSRRRTREIVFIEGAGPKDGKLLPSGMGKTLELDPVRRGSTCILFSAHKTNVYSKGGQDNRRNDIGPPAGSCQAPTGGRREASKRRHPRGAWVKASSEEEPGEFHRQPHHPVV